MSDQYSKLPRLYLDQDLKLGAILSLDENPAHYFRSVLRRQVGDSFRVFNGRDGEWVADLTELGKKSASANVIEQIKKQPETHAAVHLIFSPIKKQRMDMLIEKTVELGATDLHPILTARTEMRKINEDRIRAQIAEAAEQCERMFLPTLHPLKKLKDKIQNWSGPAPIKACIERHDAAPISTISGTEHAFLIGPEGGFDDDEIAFLTAHKQVAPISLGQTIYRAETACMICLAHAADFS